MQSSKGLYWLFMMRRVAVGELGLVAKKAKIWFQAASTPGRSVMKPLLGRGVGGEHVLGQVVAAHVDEHQGVARAGHHRGQLLAGHVGGHRPPTASFS